MLFLCIFQTVGIFRSFAHCGMRMTSGIFLKLLCTVTRKINLPTKKQCDWTIWIQSKEADDEKAATGMGQQVAFHSSQCNPAPKNKRSPGWVQEWVQEQSSSGVGADSWVKYPPHPGWESEKYQLVNLTPQCQAHTLPPLPPSDAAQQSPAENCSENGSPARSRVNLRPCETPSKPLSCHKRSALIFTPVTVASVLFSS